MDTCSHFTLEHTDMAAFHHSPPDILNLLTEGRGITNKVNSRQSSLSTSAMWVIRSLPSSTCNTPKDTSSKFLPKICLQKALHPQSAQPSWGDAHSAAHRELQGVWDRQHLDHTIPGVHSLGQLVITLIRLCATDRERLFELFYGIISTNLASSGTSQHSHYKESKSTQQDAQLLTFIMENYSQQKCHFNSLQFLVTINIFISLFSFSYTCGS